MLFVELPKVKLLWYRVALVPIVLFSLFALAGCAGIPMTKRVALEVEEDGGNIDGLRFSISKKVTLVRTYHNVSTEPVPDPTRVMELTIRNEVHLSANTKGRLKSGDVNSELNVSFEERGGNYPTLAFKQNQQADIDGKFYFHWLPNPDGERYIQYEGANYVVNYQGDEEPYLLYKRTERERRTSRRMHGLR